MVVFRFIGWVCLFFGVILFAHDVFHGLTATTGFDPIKIGSVWDWFSPGASNDLLGVMKMKYGDGAMKTVAVFVDAWAFVVLLVPGVALEAIFRPKSDQSHKRARKATAETAIEARKANARLRRKMAAR